MHFPALALAFAATSTAFNVQQRSPAGRQPQPQVPTVARAAAPPKFLNDRTKKFAVNGSNIPEVNFNVGESYAGLLPIGAANNGSELYFWFFPSTNPAADKEIVIWLSGGPGCSSTGELLSENGPMLWQPGVYKPVENKYSWHKLSNVVWVDQPVGAGFSRGNMTARSEQDVAAQFLGFWKNFVDTFSLQGYKVYVTGSSYSGLYCPYIASAMLDKNDKTYFDVRGMQIWDGFYAKDPIQQDIVTASFVESWGRMLPFNDTFMASLRKASKDCGYDDYLKKYLVFPPKSSQPDQLPGQKNGNFTDGCDLWGQVVDAGSLLNPCFDYYDVSVGCPFVYDPLGFSNDYDYIPEGSGPVYFNRSDVKAAINAPRDQEWVFCTKKKVFVDGLDTTILAGPGSLPVIPNVIDRTKNVIIGHGEQDFILQADGTLLAIQNMTWGGKLGFQTPPREPLYVPYQANDGFVNLAGGGVMGTAHSERGLTYISVPSAGHFLTSDAPSVAYRSVEVLLGRVKGFDTVGPFTGMSGNDTNFTQTASPLGVGVGLGQRLSGTVPSSPRSASVRVDVNAARVLAAVCAAVFVGLVL